MPDAPTTSGSAGQATLSDTPLVVAIDGPSGSGKSSTARGVAVRLGLANLDTGAMYRAAAWLAMHEGLDLADIDEISRNVPCLSKVAPNSDYYMEHVHRAGGIPAIMGELRRGGDAGRGGGGEGERGTSRAGQGPAAHELVTSEGEDAGGNSELAAIPLRTNLTCVSEITPAPTS